MKKYKLIIPDITGERDNIVKGFVAAEKRAKELLEEYVGNYPDCCVMCLEEDEPMYMNDFLIFCQDCYGERYWKMAVMGKIMVLHTRLLEAREEEILEELRNEVERHVSDLTEDELKKLRSEVCVGSVFLSDYANSFDIDEEEVCNVCDGYDEYLSMDEDGNTLPESEWLKDTPEEFVIYCTTWLI